MAEVQKNTDSGQDAQVFIEFVMMQQQQGLLALGRHPSRPAGVPPANLTLAQIFIRQLAMIRNKTAGNLTADEERVLSSALQTLEQLYTEVAAGARSGREEAGVSADGNVRS